MFINNVTNFKITVFKSSNTAVTRLPAWPLNAIAIPNNKANTITCNILPLAIASNGFVGNMSMITLASVGASFAS